MRVATKINLAILSTIVCAVLLVLGNLFILSEHFKGLEQSQKAQNLTRLSSSLLVLTQEYVLFKSPSVADAWLRTQEELERLITTTVSSSVAPQELSDIQVSLAELKPIFNELTEGFVPGNNNAAFLARRESLIVERLIAETQVISELGYQWSTQVNDAQARNLKGLTLLESVGLGSFVVVIAMLVVLMRTGVLNPLAKLKRTADDIRNGDEDAVCAVNTNDELGDVSKAVNQMAHNLAHKNRRLREANARVEMASQAKTEFLSNMSHEIRTPLNGIVGLTYLLKDTSASSNQKLLLESLEKTSRNLIDLVSDVLDISKIEAGSMELESKQFSTLEFIDKVSGIMTGAAANKPIELIIDPSKDLPRELMGDELRFRQIAVNLVGNAIKFTQVGHVHLSLQVLSNQGSVCRLRIEVRDTGVGISPQGQANLFRQFHQADTSVAREFGGSGLGLSLVKKLVELMNGSLGFTSELGHGSTFWAELEFAVPQEPASELIKADDTLLLVSESEFQTQALLHSCELIGRKRITVGNLEEARHFMHSAAGVAGIVMDFPKRQIDRFAWLEFVKTMGLMGVPCAVLLGSDDTRRLLDNGISEAFSAIYVKPLTPLQLQNAFKNTPSSLTAQTNSVAAIRTKMNLLIVDDSDLNLKVLEGILVRRQANITKANNGLEALSYLLQYGHGFDAVVMDVQMPLMDGLEATRELRKQPFNADLPVIGLTGEVGPEDEKRALSAGMNAVLHKPLQPEDLMYVLNKLVKLATS
ncbi:Histidine kinase [Limnobacter sp. 130]|uniref:ATP-binding protein n=1 Tax=Limnobacter sp. 130 TaxID=2653147 RepID=UPI0012F394DD|nr:ATP-binding protein [Limnobacter sp. 130]VWX37440.1 Histidine kinase [Limnobacter sp. 130]